MNVQKIAAADAIARLSEFGAIIDARSPAEWALDHLPGALNWPSLNDEERVLVGTLYAQVSPFEAQKRGAALVAANIARHIEREVMDKPRNWQPLIYCWRGGKRSGALALVLGQIGFRVSVIDSGYKAFRAGVLAQLPDMPRRFSWRVVCGPTGSGKTRLLHALRRAGAQVLDLEGLANHRSSVLGHVPGSPQPGQRRFETLIWDALRGFDPARPVYVESESKKVGDLAVPEGLMACMRASPCLDLQLPLDERVALLLEDYEWFIHNPGPFAARLDALVALRGKVLVHRWQALIASGEFDTVVRELLEHHYDPGYSSSMVRNFSSYADAQKLDAGDRSPASMEMLAGKILAGDA